MNPPPQKKKNKIKNKNKIKTRHWQATGLPRTSPPPAAILKWTRPTLTTFQPATPQLWWTQPHLAHISEKNYQPDTPWKNGLAQLPYLPPLNYWTRPHSADISKKFSQPDTPRKNGLALLSLPPNLPPLSYIPSRSSEVKSKGGFRLIEGGFLFVSHSNYGSICHRLATIHKRDRQTDRRQTLR